MKNNWILTGLFFGLFLFAIMEIIVPVSNDQALKTQEVLTGLLWWIPGGLLFGFLLWKLITRSKQNGTS
ncbi:MAG: hypothetical protein R3275_08030 [Saprospiraceae bacterium]|nr:hypothetical protein [Saprospiraceae bacterium]